jgi:uroporphyrinogen-III synthase
VVPSGPLSGRRIVLTRRPRQASTLAALLEARGATVVEVPAIEVVPAPDPQPLDAALSALERYDWLVFTSANTVNAVIGRMAFLGLEPRLGARGPRIAAAGPATAAAFRQAFPEDRLAVAPADEFGAKGLLEVLVRQGVAGARVLLPGSTRARQELPSGLRAEGAAVDVVAAYATVAPEDLAQRVKSVLDQGFDLVAFASPSAVESFAEAAGERALSLPAVAIGPTTAEAARAAGFTVRAVAMPATAEGLAAAAEAALLTASH